MTEIEMALAEVCTNCHAAQRADGRSGAAAERIGFVETCLLGKFTQVGKLTVYLGQVLVILLGRCANEAAAQR